MAEFEDICVLSINMAKSKESFNKKEQEKKRLKQRQEKQDRKEERKANSSKGKSLEDMMAYIDENGNIVSAPPDPSLRKEINVEDIEIGVPRQAAGSDEDELLSGRVDYFNQSKGFGFIIGDGSDDRIFFHYSQLQEAVSEGDTVNYDLEKGQKGWNAVNIRKTAR